MFLVYLLFALLVSVLLTAIFLLGLGRKQTWRSFLIFYLLVFLAAWAGGLWVTPVGPSVWGVYWVPFLFAGLLFALLLAATAPSRRPRSLREAAEQARQEEQVERAVGWLLWVLVAALVAAIIARYI